MATGSRLRGFRARLILLLCALLLALVAAEVLLRVFASRFEPAADVEIEYPLSAVPEFTGRAWGLLPHAEFEGRYDGDPYDTLPEGGKISYRLNEAGFRDGSFHTRRDGLTVAVLGDSFVFAEGVEEESRFTEVAERVLAAGGGTPVHLLNLGVPGYSTYEEAEVAAAMLPLIRPQSVLLGYCLNDAVQIDDEAYTSRFGFDLINRRDGLLEMENRPSPIHLWRLLARTIETRRLTKSTIDWYRSMYAGPDAPWVRSRRKILAIRDSARAVSSEFAVVLFPMFIDLEDDYPLAAAHAEVTRFCEAHGIPVLDTLPLFAGTRTESLIVHPKDRHPNARAHEIIGRAVAGFLRGG